MEDLATAYGYTRVRMQQIIDGHWSGPKANKTILEIIRDYRIRQEGKQNERTNQSNNKREQ